MYQVEVNLNNSKHDGVFEFDSVELAAVKINSNVYGFNYGDLVESLNKNSSKWDIYPCQKTNGYCLARKVPK